MSHIPEPHKIPIDPSKTWHYRTNYNVKWCSLLMDDPQKVQTIQSSPLAPVNCPRCIELMAERRMLKLIDAL